MVLSKLPEVGHLFPYLLATLTSIFREQEYVITESTTDVGLGILLFVSCVAGRVYVTSNMQGIVSILCHRILISLNITTLYTARYTVASFV